MSEPTEKKRGRPKKPEGETRVNFVCRVKPATKIEIARQAKAAGISIGEMVDAKFNTKEQP